ncbi:hypothetical protein MMC22_007154 [Lobaria immixta]|nr:hypothetical protein [Lobaria immixta]
MSTSLTTLPAELLRCIVTNVPSYRTLRNLARCSRQLYLCTIPRLYHRITIRRRIGQHNGPLFKLASLLIRRPDLARLVRHFDLDFGEPLPSERTAYSEELASPRLAELDHAFATIANASTLSKEEKISYLEGYCTAHACPDDLILALLLPALVMLEELGLYLNISLNLEQTMGRAVRGLKPFDIQPTFAALTAFIFSCDMYHALSTDFIASLLKLPAIRYISGGFESAWDYDLDDHYEVPLTDKGLIELDSSSSPLTFLDLEAYRLSAADLGHVLRAPKALKTLFYTVCAPASIDFTDLRHALRPQENYLENLTLVYGPDCDENSQSFGPMPSLISFNTLKSIKTTARSLLTVGNGIERDSLINTLPPNLEGLYLTRFHACFESLLEALEHLLAQKSPEQMPSLKCLCLDDRDSDSMDDSELDFDESPPKLMDVLWRNTQETAIGILRKVAAAHGVSVKVIEESSYEEFLGEEWDTDAVSE